MSVPAVPAPKASYSRFSSTAYIMSYIVNDLSATLNVLNDLARLRIESLVIPGKIVPSNGGVINSSSPF